VRSTNQLYKYRTYITRKDSSWQDFNWSSAVLCDSYAYLLVHCNYFSISCLETFPRYYHIGCV